MRITSALASAVALIAPAVLAQSQCSQWSPCYREGYCDSSAMFCLWGLCDESKSYNSTSCWKPEGCASQTVTFDSTNDVVPINSYSGNPNANAFLSVFDPNYASVANGNLVLQMKYDASANKGFGATVDASHTFQYGKVTARVKTASVAPGVVSSFIVRNDQTGDEIDFEWVGKVPSQVQTNYYYRDVLDYTKMVAYDVKADTSADYHDYTIEWTEDSIVWSVDAQPIRTLQRSSTFNSTGNTYMYPSTMGRIAFSIWDGGNSGAQGTQEWAGYPTPWSASTVYSMYVDSVNIECSGSSSSTPTGPSASESAGASATESGNNSDGGSGGNGGSPTSTPQKCIPRPVY
ncbi:concanavalin A-like lectin/glucanase domain-containing protein [Coemansia spiralis]|nr:concanavalin A-like lectin/glucanase domain-containing protein [Coemansia spiralis]